MTVLWNADGSAGQVCVMNVRAFTETSAPYRATAEAQSIIGTQKPKTNHSKRKSVKITQTRVRNVTAQTVYHWSLSFCFVIQFRRSAVVVVIV